MFAVVALRGSAAAGVRGERKREARRSYSPLYLEQRRCEEAAPRWPARGGGYGSEWRRWGAGEGASGGSEVRGGGGARREGLFIGGERQWRRGRCGGW